MEKRKSEQNPVSSPLFYFQKNFWSNSFSAILLKEFGKSYFVDNSQAVESVGQETHHDGGHYEEAAHQDPEYEEGGAVSLLVSRDGAGRVEPLPRSADRQAEVVSEVGLPVQVEVEDEVVPVVLSPD